MKALSIRQPWAHLIVAGIKRVENREWSTAYRGPLLIHAAMRFADMPIAFIEQRYDLRLPPDLPIGCVVGVVDLIDVVGDSDDRFFTGPFGFVLANARTLQTPLYCEGRQRIFDLPSITLRDLHSAR